MWCIHVGLIEMTQWFCILIRWRKNVIKHISLIFSFKRVINPFAILGCKVFLLTVFPTGRGILLCNAIVSATILCVVLLLFIDMLLFLWCIVLIFYYA